METKFIDLRSFLIKVFNAINFFLYTALAAAYELYHVVIMSLSASSNTVLVLGWLLAYSFQAAM